MQRAAVAKTTAPEVDERKGTSMYVDGTDGFKFGYAAAADRFDQEGAHPMCQHLSLLARAIVVVALAASAGGLAACGSSDDDGDPATSAQAPTTSADAPAAGDSSDEQGKKRTAPDDSERSSSGGGSAGVAPATGGTGGSASGGAPSETQPGAPPAGKGKSSERASVERVVEKMYASFAAGDAAGVCSVMSTTAQEEIAQQVPGGSTVEPGARTCEQSLGKFLDIARRNGMLERIGQTTVTRVKIAGRGATVTVVIAGTPGDISLVREGGDWRFGAAPSIGKG